MAYEYEKENIRKLKSYNVLSGGANITKPIDELQEAYRKARAFDEISNMLKRCDYYDRDTGLDVIEIVDKYEERADDE
ncbi:hypothetical protein BU100_07110 [Staphylococcus xylosus]|uniref:hypothetical protein n=1 Tax=Staphylococcus xylosus TaxID=1288 RepID=UPI000E69C738|nr:hypothetical protein [Staphylococcus xylosus]RIM94765.1 hypothetical protein BU100_07110 [Staphylococcus xylosus]